MYNKRTIQSLIRTGAFDPMGHTRRTPLARCDEAVNAIIDVKRNEAFGQLNLFGAFGDEEPVADSSLAVNTSNAPEFDCKVKLAQEREMLGLYVSDHPPRGLEGALVCYQDYEIAQVVSFGESMAERIVKIAGLVSDVRTKVMKQGLVWTIATIEDLSGSVETLLFPHTYETIQIHLVQDVIVQMEGRVNVRDEGMSTYSQPMTPVDAREDCDTPTEVELPVARCIPSLLRELKNVLESFPGASPMHLRIRKTGCTTFVELDPKLRVTQSSTLSSQIKAVVGVDRVRVSG